ncbi:MAG: toll/interleukin-1 receptor domain-containing protein [Chloroflexota bacterium]
MPDKYNFSDVFVSYAREDSEFVKKVVDVLFDRGYEVWVDWDDIPHTVDWWEEIVAGIDASNIFIAILTDNFANSKVCYKEVQYALENNKRIVPVVPTEFDETTVECEPIVSFYRWV